MQQRKIDIILIHWDSFYGLEFSHFNMGLLYIATMLKERGFRVLCMDSPVLFYLPLKDLQNYVKTVNPAIIGFYTLADNIFQVKNLAKILKEASPETKVVVGGPQAVVKDKELLDFPQFDIVVRGEGEFTMLSLAEYFINGKGKLEEIPGITYRREDGIGRNETPPPIKDLDCLPFPDHGLVTRKYALNVVSGRGCPYSCTFCFSSTHGAGYRFRSALNVFEEIKVDIEKYGVTAFSIIDDTFVANPSRVIEICEYLSDYRKERGADFIFFCEGRANIIRKNPELITYLKDAGLERMQIGMESGDEAVLELYNKKITVDDIAAAVAECEKRGLASLCGNFIIGGPGENQESFEKTLNLARNLLDLAPGVFECSSSFLYPFPGTDIEKNPDKYGLKVLDREFKKALTLEECVVSTERLAREDIRNLKKRFDNEIGKQMLRVAPKVDPGKIKKHFRLAKIFRTFTQWYLRIYSRFPAVVNFFGFMESAAFKMMKDVKKGELLNAYPSRTMQNMEYSEDGKEIILEGAFKKIRLKDNFEKRFYELSSGKLTIKEILEELQNDFPDADNRKNMLKLLRKLEKNYYVALYA